MTLTVLASRKIGQDADVDEGGDDDAHHPQEPTGKHQRPSLVRGEPVLLTGILIATGVAVLLGLIARSRRNRKKLLDR